MAGSEKFMACMATVSMDLKPCRMGVPTAPKVTGTLLKARQTTAAHRGGKPRPSSRGAAKAAGVPKPAAPSMKAANMKPMMMVCRRLSGLILLMPAWMVSMAPLYCMV